MLLQGEKQPTDSGSKKDPGANIEQLAEEDSDVDGDLVPVEIRPGHIRFAPSGKGPATVLPFFELCFNHE